MANLSDNDPATCQLITSHRTANDVQWKISLPPFSDVEYIRVIFQHEDTLDCKINSAIEAYTDVNQSVPAMDFVGKYRLCRKTMAAISTAPNQGCVFECHCSSICKNVYLRIASFLHGFQICEISSCNRF